MDAFIALIPITLFIVLGYVIQSFFKGRQAKHAIQAQLEIQQKMLDRFSSSQDLMAFIQTPEGRQYLEKFTEEPITNPMDRTLSSVRTGIIITFIGAGLIVVGAMLGYEIGDNGPMLFGFLGVFLGAGFLVSAFASYKLAKQWGMIDRKTAAENLST